MYRKRTPRQATCFIPGALCDYIPEDHILKRVDRVLDLSWLPEEVEALYDEATGRPCIDPEQAVRLMLAGFFHGVVHDRKLMREAQVNIAYRWFAGYELDEPLPDHSSLTRIRQRWGEERFREIFERSVSQCVQAGLVGGDLVHVDASLIRADVSWRSLVRVHVSKVLEENEAEAEEGPPDDDSPATQPAGRPKTRPAGKLKKVSTTDSDASMATANRGHRLEPSYKQHTAVDDRAGVIVDVHVTTGEANEGQQLPGQLERVTQQTGQLPQMVTADSAYASSANYAALEELGVEAVIPPQRERLPRGGMPLQRFAYDAHHDVVVCPSGKYLCRNTRAPNGWIYRARARDCRGCPLKERCLPPTARRRSVCIKDGYCALLRARRRKQRGWPEPVVDAFRRHRWQVEGIHGEAKSQHGLRRAVRRGTSNMRIQAYLTAAVLNLKRLAMHAARVFAQLLCRNRSRPLPRTLGAVLLGS
jgi:transposase